MKYVAARAAYRGGSLCWAKNLIEEREGEMVGGLFNLVLREECVRGSNVCRKGKAVGSNIEREI